MADISRLRSGKARRLGAYRLESSLGKGGMGEVFLAWDERLHRRVAIKWLRGDLPVEPHHRRRFRREARAVARLNHPAIVQIYDILEADLQDGETDDAIVMEYVEGRTLAEALAQGEFDQKEGLDLALCLAWEVADALAEAHAQGLVHRDLKPGNILMTRAGHAKIVDFGLARMLWGEVARAAEDASSAALTQAGALVGTVHAMSPEQAGGRTVDHRSDLFALGGVLYEMLTGKAPFRGENLLDTLRRIHSETPESLARLRPDLPTPLIELVESLLAKDPGDRPQNARVVADALERLRRPTTFPHPDPGFPKGVEDLPTGEWPTPRSAIPDTVVRVLVLTSLVGAMRVVQSLGDSRAAALQSRLDRSARDLLARHSGLEIDKSDRFLLLFERPADAVGFALAYHQALECLGQQEGVELVARVGIHLGEVVLRRNPEADVARGAKPLEVTGLARPVAARVMALAGPRQTLLTRGAFDLARRAAVGAEGAAAEPPLHWLAHGEYLLTDPDAEPAADETTHPEAPVAIFEVGLEGFAPLRAPADTAQARRAVVPGDEPTLGWRPATGQTIPHRPHWTLTERLGEGGFGEVWLAEHKSGERRVFKFCFEAARVRALKREVTYFRLIKETLGHRDDIARIYDWHFEKAPYFLEAEYTEGGNLASWAAEQGGLAAVPLATRLELAAEAAEALAAAHSVGILHKDVKPENILITTDREGQPRARLTDFGIGLLTEKERLEEPGFTALGFTETLTPTESSDSGTLGYLAPELIEGKAPTVQSDLYSLGVLFYQLVVADFSRTLAPGWERDIDDAILVQDIAHFVDGRPERRPAGAREVVDRLRTLEARRAARAEEEAQRLAYERSQRRRRQASVVAGVAVLVTAVTIVMAVRESRARQEAEAARETAALRRAQAEGLIDFMLGDLRQKLDGVGRLDVLDSVDGKALEYFAAVPAKELSEQELAYRSQALYQIGQVKIRRGQLEEALKPMRESLALARELQRRDPESSNRLFDLGQSLFWVGSPLLSQGKTAEARKYLEEYLNVSRRLAAAEPDNLDYQMELSYAWSNMGSLAQAEGDMPGALESFTQSLEINQAVVEQAPQNQGWQFELAAAHNTVGFVLRSLHRLDEAREHLQKELEIRQELVRLDPQNQTYRGYEGASHGFLADLLIKQGHLSQALEHAEAFRGILQDLVQHDPENRQWQYRLAASYGVLAPIRKAQGDTTGALGLWEKEREILAELTRLDPDNTEWRTSLATILMNLAQTRLRLGETTKVKRLLKELSELGVHDRDLLDLCQQDSELRDLCPRELE